MSNASVPAAGAVTRELFKATMKPSVTHFRSHLTMGRVCVVKCVTNFPQRAARLSDSGARGGRGRCLLRRSEVGCFLNRPRNLQLITQTHTNRNAAYGGAHTQSMHTWLGVSGVYYKRIHFCLEHLRCIQSEMDTIV